MNIIESASRDVTCNVSTRMVNGVVGAGLSSNLCSKANCVYKPAPREMLIQADMIV